MHCSIKAGMTTTKNSNSGKSIQSINHNQFYFDFYYYFILIFITFFLPKMSSLRNYNKKIWESAKDDDFHGVKKRTELKGKDIIDTEKHNDGSTALMIASFFGHFSILKYFT